MLIRKLLLYGGTSKVNPATFPAVQRRFSVASFPPMTFRCKPTLSGQYSQQNLGQQDLVHWKLLPAAQLVPMSTLEVEEEPIL